MHTWWQVHICIPHYCMAAGPNMIEDARILYMHLAAGVCVRIVLLHGSTLPPGVHMCAYCTCTHVHAGSCMLTRWQVHVCILLSPPPIAPHPPQGMVAKRQSHPTLPRETVLPPYTHIVGQIAAENEITAQETLVCRDCQGQNTMTNESKCANHK